MGIFDRSKSVTTQQSLTENTQRNVNVQDSQGAIAITDVSGAVSIMQTDFNAIDRATALADVAVRASESLGRQSMALSYDTAELVTDFADRSNERVAVIADESRADFAGLANDFLERSLEFARETNTKFQSAISSTVDAIQHIGIQQNKSTDERLSDVTERTTKYMLIAVGILGLAVVGFAALRR